MSEFIRCNFCGNLFRDKADKCPMCGSTKSFSIRTASSFVEARLIFAEEEKCLDKQVQSE